MKDQVEKLTNLGIPAATLSEIEEEKAMGLKKGDFSIVYVSLEAWLNYIEYLKPEVWN